MKGNIYPDITTLGCSISKFVVETQMVQLRDSYRGSTGCGNCVVQNLGDFSLF